MDTQYNRVIPRDLFNEAKLLKGVGRLVLLIHDGNNPSNVKFVHDGEPFEIGLMDEGYLSINNITFTINGKQIEIVSQYNATNNYTLIAYYDYCEYVVFDEEGNYTTEFIEFCNTLK
jgi:hypothetical protein